MNVISTRTSVDLAGAIVLSALILTGCATPSGSNKIRQEKTADGVIEYQDYDYMADFSASRVIVPKTVIADDLSKIATFHVQDVCRSKGKKFAVVVFHSDFDPMEWPALNGSVSEDRFFCMDRVFAENLKLRVVGVAGLKDAPKDGGAGLRVVKNNSKKGPEKQISEGDTVIRVNGARVSSLQSFTRNYNTTPTGEVEIELITKKGKLKKVRFSPEDNTKTYESIYQDDIKQGCLLSPLQKHPLCTVVAKQDS